MGRFINADNYPTTGQGLTGNNMFAYCGNNPVSRVDIGGYFWDTVFDVASLVFSVADVISDPTDVGAWIGLACDIVDVAIPFVGGLGETARAVNAAMEIADTVDDIRDAGKAADNVIDSIDDMSDAYKAASGGLCFVAGTVVHTADGYIEIEDIDVGQFVWAWDESTNSIALKKVIETYVNKTDELVHVFVNGEEIIATPNHPFYSPVKGWTEAVHLRAGDILVLVNGEYVVVEQVQHEILETPVTVYNFNVSDYHTYYVARAGVLVHNSCATIAPIPDDGIRVTTDDALDMAENYLGPGYTEVGKNSGRYVSADGSRQVRIGDNDILGRHGGGSHINFEALIDNTLKPGKKVVVTNHHVYIY